MKLLTTKAAGVNLNFVLVYKTQG